MADNCFSLVRGRAMRLTKLDSCGRPVYGSDSVVTSKGFIQVSLTANTDSGTEISVTNANGDICIRDTPPPRFLGYTAEIQFCEVDPRAFSLTTGQDAIVDETGNAIGFGMDTAIDLSEAAFALELWSTVPGEACAGGDKSYGYILIPFLQGGTVGDFTVGNDAVNFTVSGAVSKDGNSWGVGPFNVTKTAAGVPAPLHDPISPTRHLHVQLVKLAPPTEVCGGTALGTPATSFTAGSPATPVPANSYAPKTLAGLTGKTASPATAWTAGQYVQLGDGSEAHWTGTAWAAGPA